LFALPLLMTGEKVGDIGAGAGLGLWVLQGVGMVSGTWRGQAAVIASGPDGRLRHGRG